MSLRQRVNGLLKPLGRKIKRTPDGLRLIRLEVEDSFHLHKYKSYDEYRETQIRWNKAKIDKIFADAQTLEAIATDIEKRGLKSGICHGARNGFEVGWFRKRLGSEVIGTDISSTCLQYPNMFVQDFHEPRAEWLGMFDFVYTNSLDHAMNPQKALKTWAGQLTPAGRIYIEHTRLHTPARAGETDPFGAKAEAMPGLISSWGLTLDDVIELAAERKGRVWVFVVSG